MSAGKAKTTPPPKFCKDCKHCSSNHKVSFTEAFFGSPFGRSWTPGCLRPDPTETETKYLVTGIKREEATYRGTCESQRAVNSAWVCGPIGQYWEAK